MSRFTGGNNDTGIYFAFVAGSLITPDASTSNEQEDEEDVPLEPEKHAGPCHHEYEWETQREATATTVGLMYYKCRKCGYVAQVLEISGFSAFVEDVCSSISNAEFNANVTVDTKMWVSYPESVFDELEKRTDVSLTTNYKYKGKQYTVTIPSNADLSDLVDENGYCGFRQLDARFAGSEITK